MTNLKFRTVSVLSLLAAVASGCSDNATSLADGEPTTGTVEPAGGSVSGAGATIVVPAGGVLAAAELTVASVTVTSLQAPAPVAGSGPVIAVTPYGMSFAQEVQVTIPAPAGAGEVLRVDDETDTTWESVTAPVFGETSATFGTLSTGVFVATAPSSVSTDGTGGTTGATDDGTGGDTMTDGTGGDTTTDGTGGGTSSDSCGGVIGSEYTSGCDTCLDSVCCSQKAACLADTKCTDYINCMYGGMVDIDPTAVACREVAEITDVDAAVTLAGAIDACAVNADAEVDCSPECG